MTSAEPTSVSRRRRLIVMLLAVALSLGAGYAYRTPLLSAVGHWLDVGSEPTSVDCIVTLPGEFNTRPFVAAAWMQAGLARQAWVLKSQYVDPTSTDPYDVGDGGISHLVLKKFGVSEDQIVVLEGRTVSTRDDAELIASRLKTDPRLTLAVVTSDFHTRRTRWVMSRVFADLPNRFIMVSAPTDMYGPDNWWQSQAGVTVYTSEYVKLLAYWGWYGAGKWWAAGACVLMAWCVWRRSTRATRSAS